MKTFRLAVILLIPFLAATPGGPAWAKVSGIDDPDSRPVPASLQESSPGGEIVHSSLASLCPDIADTQPFRDAGLGYVRSVEFARSVFAVANGTSKYSPPEIPPNWKAAAYGWWTHVATAAKASIRYIPVETGAATTIRPRIQTTIGRQIDWERESLQKDSCDPYLLFRASLDYREKTGQEGIALVFPYRVRMASERLGEKISAKYEAANRLAAWADSIQRQISDAERMGASVCEPVELARVKAAFADAVDVATDIQRTLEEAETALARVNESSAKLLSQRQYASSRGILCFHN